MHDDHVFHTTLANAVVGALNQIQSQVPLLWLHPPQDFLTGNTLEKVQSEYDDVPITLLLLDNGQLPHVGSGGDDSGGGTLSSKRLLVFDDEMADHCHQLYAPDEYFAELLTFTRTHSEWGAATQVRS